eukprot:CAMPEP_0197046270 /NCGR_PEP_ID=MMETSP1384-20130603/22001_1 /TAXON_ID=29189 /ORGANISM="Ammonia sp." /LENGTH=55 /DNA_ID=CAMNT_0042478023 /DNA_START=1 /DNA_END=165 /DNA_ORIENTATION=-
MSQHIHSDLKAFPHSYPKYQRLFDYIAIRNESLLLGSNADIDEEKVVDLWIDATY